MRYGVGESWGVGGYFRANIAKFCYLCTSIMHNNEEV